MGTTDDRGRARGDADDLDPATGDDPARRRMVEHDLVGRGITDPAVLDAMRSVPRHRFVGAGQAAAAYDDRPLPIGDGQTISQPYVVALTAESLALRPADRVLDVGTGSGYAAAVLGTIAAEVWSIERHRGLAERAAATLADLGYSNVHVVTGDGTAGLVAHAPFDAIAVAAASKTIPTALTDQLAEGGRLVIPVGPSRGTQRLVLVRRDGDALVERHITDVRFVPLVEGPATSRDEADAGEQRPDGVGEPRRPE